MRRFEREMEAAIARALNRLRIDVAKDITDGNVQDMVSRLKDSEFTRPFQDAIVTELQRVSLAGSDFGRQQVERFVFGTGKALEVGMWELANNAAAQWALRYGYDLVRGLLDTTRDRLQKEIAEYVQNSQTIGQLVSRIRGDNLFGEERARMIAVTEVTRAFAAGNMEAWRASGVIEKRQFNVNRDELVCPICGPLNGKVVGLDEEFDEGIDGPPVHPRCRCWLSPVVV
jgi:SPP1 gp7 family putative phage head morphogenesis protein